MAQEKIFIENGIYNLSNFVTQKTMLNLLNNKIALSEIVLIYLILDKSTFCISKRVKLYSSCVLHYLSRVSDCSYFS